MRELQLSNGDYVPDGLGGVKRVDGREALLQRVLFKLTARRGQFPFLEGLGSTLYRLGTVPAGQRQSAAEQAAVQALADEDGLRLEEVALDGGTLTVRLDYQGEELELRLDTQ